MQKNFSTLVTYGRVVSILSLRFFQDRYAGSFFGFFWACLGPMLQLIVFWIVFGYGVKIQSDAAHPYFYVLCCALLPWMFFSESVSSSVGSITGRAFLVKKIYFPLIFLPVINIISGIFVHLILLGLFLIFYFLMYDSLSLALLMLPYYIICNLVFIMGISFLLSAIAVFIKDLQHAIIIILNIVFWITPIVWNINLIPENYRIFYSFNPIYYITNGYSNSILSNIPLYPKLIDSFIFWIMSITILVFGIYVFSKLKPRFLDCL